MDIAVPLLTAHFEVKDAERDGVRPICTDERVAAPAGKPFLHLGNGLGELRPDVVAETLVTLPRALIIAVLFEVVLESSYCGRNGNQANAATEAGKSLLAGSGNSDSYSGNSGVGSVASGRGGQSR